MKVTKEMKSYLKYEQVKALSIAYNHERPIILSTSVFESMPHLILEVDSKKFSRTNCSDNNRMFISITMF